MQRKICAKKSPPIIDHSAGALASFSRAFAKLFTTARRHYGRFLVEISKVAGCTILISDRAENLGTKRSRAAEFKNATPDSPRGLETVQTGNFFACGGQKKRRKKMTHHPDQPIPNPKSNPSFAGPGQPFHTFSHKTVSGTFFNLSLIHI